MNNVARLRVVPPVSTPPDFEAWLRAQGFAHSTIQQRVRFADRRLHAWGTWDHAPAFVAGWLEGYTGWTRRTYQNHLTSVYAWLEATAQVAVSPVASIRSPPPPHPRPAPFPMELAREVVAAAPDERLRSWLLLGLYAGLRRHEIAKVRGRDITESSLYVLGKGGKGAEIPTHPVLWELARTLPAGYWFPSPQRDRLHVSPGLITLLVAKHFRSLGLSGSIHRMRATYGTELLRSGVNLRVIQDLLRHASLSSTAHYLGVDESERQAAIRTLSAA